MDSGTYAYTFDVAARNEMRSSAAHNITTIDGAELNPIPASQVFALPQVAHPRVESFAADAQGRVKRLVVSHDGYERLEPPLTIRRTIGLELETGAVTVEDELLGHGRRTAETTVHLAAGATARVAGTGRVEVELRNERFDLSFSPELEVSVREGWVSDRYGRREPGLVVAAGGVMTLPVTIAYLVEPVPARDPGSAESGTGAQLGSNPR